MKQRIYIDTSVIGGYYDEEFEEDTKKFFEKVEKKEIILVISEVTQVELAEAPENVRNHLSKYSEGQIENVELTLEARELAEKYISENITNEKHRADCRHIAIATVNKVDVLSSWNFRHIVNLDKIRGYNSVNLRLGYKQLEIRTPKEILRYEE